jgi:hypothetical protein
MTKTRQIKTPRQVIRDVARYRSRSQDEQREFEKRRAREAAKALETVLEKPDEERAAIREVGELRFEGKARFEQFNPFDFVTLKKRKLRHVDMDSDELRDRYAEATRELAAAGFHEVSANVNLAVGFLLGSDMPGCAAAVVFLMRRCYPDREFPTIFGD